MPKDRLQLYMDSEEHARLTALSRQEGCATLADYVRRQLLWAESIQRELDKGNVIISQSPEGSLVQLDFIRSLSARKR